MDIGCGIGLLAAYLREEGLQQPILGIEPDAGKVASARESVATRYPGLTFDTGDARALPGFSGDLILLDILHYMQPDEQQSALGGVAARIAPGGCALIRTTFLDRSCRYYATMLEDIGVRATGWIRGGRCHFPTRYEVESAFPASQFIGFDTHPDSVKEARDVATQAGVAKNVTFAAAKADDYPGTGYDLICFFDCLHDMGDPVAAAAHAAKAIKPDGTVMLVEPFANDRVEDNISPVGRIYYAASTTICCAHAISEGGRMVLGAQAGEARLADVFRKAGFTRFRRALETPFNLVLEARL
jgi:2-polyprenyl-3-methyl-5-hydroxy-6-metoxy-1,4-benzoquinol methylase